MTTPKSMFRGPWAGLPIAWTNDDRFDEATYRSDVARTCAIGAPGVYTGGTTGEWYALEFEEFCEVSRATVEECHAANKPAMIGVTSTFTRGACRRAEYAARIGADAIQVAFPCWLEIDDRLVVPFLKEVAGAASLPLSLYETKRSKKTLNVEQHLAIKAAIPGYEMVKATSGTVGSTVEGCAVLSAQLSVFAPDSKWRELGPHGVAGWCSSAIYWGPKFTLALWDHVERCEWDAAHSGCAKLAAFYAFLFQTFGHRGMTDGAYDRIGGLASGWLHTSLKNRGPYASAQPEDVKVVRHYFEVHFPEMLDTGSAPRRS